MAHHRRGPSAPPTRWEQTVTGKRWDFYVEKFDRHVADGDDLDGEARFIDALAPRGAQILDGGAGTGRVAAALTRMGHRCLGVDRDAGLLDRARTGYPGVSYLTSDLLNLDPDVLADEGFAGAFDIVALPGNVLVYVAPGTERAILEQVHRLLVPDGRLVVGFATDREYAVPDFDADLAAIGFTLEHRFATWQLDRWTPDDDWHVSVARRP